MTRSVTVTLGKHPRKTSQQRLLQYIFDHIGGCGEVARLLGTCRQTPLNWIKRGAVPLDVVARVGWALGKRPEALNYEGVIPFNTSAFIPTWEEIVDSVVEEKEDYDRILAGKKPKTRDALLNLPIISK